MGYRELFREVVGKPYARKEMIANSPVFIVIFRQISYLLTPLFVMLNISANGVTCIHFVGSLIAVFIITLGSQVALAIGISLFFFFCIIDCVDGNIARLKNQTSFYGRFIDGIVDTNATCFLHLALSYVVFTQFQNYPLMWVGIISVIAVSFHNFIFDRYSAYIRWMNKEKSLNVTPYIRRTMSLRFINLMSDVQYLLLIILAIHFVSFILWLFFLINIYIASIYLFGHIMAAYKFMKVQN
jgi:phosphatidylglycerophosphate synthase